MTSPVIVTGPPRSGTTFVTALLNDHPDFCVTNESRIFVAPVHFAKSLSIGAFAFATGPTPLELLEAYGYSSEEPALTALRAVRKLNVSFPDHGAAVVEANHSTPKYVGDKFPGYVGDRGMVEAVVATVRDAKWVFIYRDLAETVRSQLRMNFNETEADAVRGHCANLELGVHAANLLGTDRFLPISYDRLLSPEKRLDELRMIANFFDVSDTPFVEFFSESGRGYVNYSAGARSGAEKATIKHLPDDIRAKVGELQGRLEAISGIHLRSKRRRPPPALA